MRHPHQRTFSHACQLVDVPLDFGGVDVVTAADDQVLAAPHDGDVALRVNLAHVASFKKPIGGELFFCFFRHAPVALENIGALDLDAADLT